MLDNIKNGRRYRQTTEDAQDQGKWRAPVVTCRKTVLLKKTSVNTLIKTL